MVYVPHGKCNHLMHFSFLLIFAYEVPIGIPIITQSDPETENHGVANAHTVMCHCLDPSLTGTLQYILEQGVQSGWYNVSQLLLTYLFSNVFPFQLTVPLDCSSMATG